MRLLRDFKCGFCGVEQERFVDTHFTQIQCDCGGVAYRMVGMPNVKLEGITGAFPGAHDRWAGIR
jgi:hypothetical protein